LNREHRLKQTDVFYICILIAFFLIIQLRKPKIMKKSIPFLFLLIFNVALAQDIATIKQRLITTYKATPSKSTVDSALNLMDASGGFTDLNYSGDTDLRVHLSRINSLASAYMNSSNLSTYYNNSTIKQKYYLSLNYWITKNHTPTNWWYRQIAYPKEVSKGFVLLADNLKVDNLSLYNSAVSYLMWGYNQGVHMDGANISDTVIGALGAAVCESNTVALGQFRDWIDSLLLIDDSGEGIGADYMFAQHSGYGRQINTTSYGNEMCKSVLSYIEATIGTVYGVTRLVNLENCILNAYQWIVFKNRYDPSTSGRNLNSFSSMAEIISISDRMLALNSPQKAALTIANQRFKGANTLVGNSMYWRLDYMIHRTQNYLMSTRMTSTRTVSTESDGVSVGLNNYYSGAGVNYITVSGSEYNGNYFTNFNYRQFPGTTAEQDTGTLPRITWGQGGTNGNAFAGGVSNGTIGCSGMIWNKRKVTAYKSWFFFPDETVALGSGVTETGGTANVYTTLNQTNFNAVEGVSHEKGGVVTITKTASNFNVVAPSWFYHGSIGYANIDTSPTQSFAVNTNNGVVSMAVDHGINPANKKYSYIILPNATLATMPALVAGFSEKIVVESNTAAVQAVTHTALNTTQIVFSSYLGGTLAMSTGDNITTNTACTLIIDRTAGRIYVSNPRAESAGTSVLVTYLKDGVTASNTIVFPTGNLSGSTTSFSLSNLSVDSFQPNAKTQAKVVCENNSLSINANFPIDSVAIYTMSGSKIHSFEGNGAQEIEENFVAPTGIYIVIINNKVTIKTINKK
jgi:chondroitin AC lyase